MNRRVAPVKSKQSPKRRGAKPAKAKVEAKRPVARKSGKGEGSRVGDLETRLAEALQREASVARGRGGTAAATVEILRVISRSPSDIRPVFDADPQACATRLCEAVNARSWLRWAKSILHSSRTMMSPPEPRCARARVHRPRESVLARAAPWCVARVCTSGTSSRIAEEYPQHPGADRRLSDRPQRPVAARRSLDRVDPGPRAARSSRSPASRSRSSRPSPTRP